MSARSGMAVPVGRFFLPSGSAACYATTGEYGRILWLPRDHPPGPAIGEVWSSPCREWIRIDRRPGADRRRQAVTAIRPKNKLGGQRVDTDRRSSRGLCRAAIGAGSFRGQPSERLQEREPSPVWGRVSGIAGSRRKQKKIYHYYAFA